MTFELGRLHARSNKKIPFCGARRFASSLLGENDVLRQERDPTKGGGGN